VYFDDKDVVRHNLVMRIVRAYEHYNEITGADRQLSLKLGEDREADAAKPGATPEEAPPSVQ